MDFTITNIGTSPVNLTIPATNDHSLGCGGCDISKKNDDAFSEWVWDVNYRNKKDKTLAERLWIRDNLLTSSSHQNPTIYNHTYENGTTTILWSDNTKTTVHSDPNAPTTTEYAGFMIALAKKFMGNGNKASNLADFWLVKVPEQRKKREEVMELERAEKARKEEKRKIKREKNRIRIEAIKRKQAFEAAKMANEKYGVPMPPEFNVSNLVATLEDCK